MQADFWHAMWDSGVVGFHQSDINGFLKQHWNSLALTGQEEVLVPLCGKSLDMLWLADKGHDVLGVELSPKALEEFLAENKLTGAPVQHHQFCGYELDKMTLLCGDFFHLCAQDCQTIQAVYDRAALVALPFAMRQQYAEHLIEVLPPKTQMLLVTLEYDEALLQGPPFNVSETEVGELFGQDFVIKKVQTSEAMRKGVAVAEKVYILVKNG